MKGIITLRTNRTIHAGSTNAWDKAVFEDCFKEFYMQSQFYNQNSQYSTFKEMVEAIPAAAKINYLVSTAAHGHIQWFKDKLPDVLNSNGKRFLPCTKFSFDILQAHVTKKNEFSCKIEFVSQPMYWIDTLQDRLLISIDPIHEESVETELIALPPNVKISSFKKI